MKYNIEQINVISLRKKTLLDALLEIEKKPYLWLSESNILCLKSFLNGWIEARDNEVDENLLMKFDDFVAEKFNEGSSTSGWCNLIVKHCGEEDTLVSFFDIYSEFLENIEE